MTSGSGPALPTQPAPDPATHAQEKPKDGGGRSLQICPVSQGLPAQPSTSLQLMTTSSTVDTMVPVSSQICTRGVHGTHEDVQVHVTYASRLFAITAISTQRHHQHHQALAEASPAPPRTSMRITSTTTH